MDAVPLEKAPKIAVYTPPNAPPWDDAVTLALKYAGIEYDEVWDDEVVTAISRSTTGCTCTTRTSPGSLQVLPELRDAPWFVGAGGAQPRRWRGSSASQRAGAEEGRRRDRSRDYVERGGFLFAMCGATETLELAIAADNVDIAAAYADGTPMDPDATSKMDWKRRSPSRTRTLRASPTMPVTPTSTATRSTRRSAGSRSARSRCSTSARSSIRSRRCWCRTTAT